MTVRERRDKLRADWKPKSAEHAAAREYLLKTWPALAAIADYKESLPQFRASVAACVRAGDRLALRKLLTHLNAAAVKLGDLASPLDPNSDTDRKALADANEVRQALEKADQEVREFVKGGS